MLLDGLERLKPDAFVQWAFSAVRAARVHCVFIPLNIEHNKLLAVDPGRRTAIISAIERLIEEAEK